MTTTRESSPFPAGLGGRAGGKPGAEAFVNLSRRVTACIGPSTYRRDEPRGLF
jgi:hypothetical protein